MRKHTILTVVKRVFFPPSKFCYFSHQKENWAKFCKNNLCVFFSSKYSTKFSFFFRLKTSQKLLVPKKNWKKKFVENNKFLQLVIFKKRLYNQKACPELWIPIAEGIQSQLSRLCMIQTTVEWGQTTTIVVGVYNLSFIGLALVGKDIVFRFIIERERV